MTFIGHQILPFIERIADDTENVRRVSRQFAKGDEGTLRIATTHTQARYTLPPIISRYRAAYPKVRLALRECSPAEIVVALRTGEADVGVATEAIAEPPDLAAFAYREWRHVLIVPVGHPLGLLKAPTIEDVAAYPIVTYEEGLTGRSRIDQAFALWGRVPDVAVSARDADVIKAYVELGLGIGIVAAVAFDETHETHLRAIEVADLGGANISYVAFKRGVMLRDYALGFLEMSLPDFDERAVRRALARIC